MAGDADPFDQFDAGKTVPGTASNVAVQPADANVFDQFGPQAVEPTSATGAFARSAALGVAPAAGGLVAAGAGAEAGAGIGAFGGPIGAGVGAFVGGVAGAFAGSAGISKAQSWLLSKLPDDWKESFDDEQQADQAQHPIASFLGGLAPYAVTLTPGGLGKAAAKLPENATAFQKIMAHSVTARLFGGAAMGGMEVAQEKAQGQPVNWTDAAIATGFGMIFNKPNTIGERLTEAGGAPIRNQFNAATLARGLEGAEPQGRVRTETPSISTPGEEYPSYPGLSFPGPTVAQVADGKVLGPGVTESVFQGTEEQAPEAAMTAQANARTEQSLIGDAAPQPDLHGLVRRMEPDLFEKYDALSAQRDEFRTWIDQFNNPPDTALNEIQAQRTALEEQLAAVPTSGAGRNLPEARRLRAQIRDVQSQYDELAGRQNQFTAGQAQETPELAQARQHLLATDYQMRDLAPQVAAAYRRAAEAAGGGFVEPEVMPAEQAAASANPSESITPAPMVPNEGKVTGYQTALGSEYTVHEDGTTTRNKSSHIGAGHDMNDIGIKPRSEKTLYVDDPKNAVQLSAAGLIGLGPKGARIIIKDGKASLLTWNTKANKWGIAPGQKDIPVHTEPAVGRAPLELWKPADDVSGYEAYSNMHAGNAITRLDRESVAVPTPAETVTAGAQPIEAQRAYIANDVMQQLVKAGRPMDEAEASGQLIAARYETRAVRLGTSDQALDLYRREGALIKGAPPPTVSSALDRPVEAEYAQTPTKELDQTARGKIRLSQDARPTITLLRDANASTFIHESSHQWLEELLRDSGHDAAPDQLKNDAGAVRTWLGAAEGAEIKRGQHEKFARGFEQYMREGVAPSPQLAGVFGKFRNWLLNIYQTLKGLGQPINEDIRGVFDRMLSAEPQRTVIAPDFTPGPSLADVHAGDAALTERGERGAVADRIAAERNRFIQEPPPEIAYEIAPAIQQIEAERAAAAGSAAGTEPAGEIGSGPGGSGQVVPGGSQPEPVAGRGGVGASRGTLSTSGSEPAAEIAGGAGRGSGQRSQSGAASGPQQLAPQPRNDFADRDSPFVDKAGNIRIENLTTSQDVAQAIRDAADENNDFIGDRRGVVTDGQVMELADALGMDAAKLSTRKIGQAFNAEQVVAARRLLIQSATDVSAAMKKAAASSSTDEEVLAYATAKDRHQMIQAQVAGITAEAGRALRAFRSIAGQETAQGIDQFIRQATGKTLFQLRGEAKLGATLNSPEKISKFLNDGQKRTFGRMLLEYWVNGLISGPATHTTYMIGNTILALEKAGPETAVASLIGRLRANMGRSGETVRLGEVGAQLRAAIGSLPAGTEAAIEALRTGSTTLLPGETARPGMPFSGDQNLVVGRTATNAPVTWGDVGAEAFGAVRGIRDGLISGAALLKAGGIEGSPLLGLKYQPTGAIPDITLRGVNVLPVGTAARLPSRGVAAIHSFFRAVNYSMGKAALAYRAASEEGLRGTVFDARVADLRQNPTDEMMESARESSTQLTLMGNGSEFVQALSRLTNTKILGFPFLKFVDPFVHIAGNVMDQSIVQRTPLGILAPEIRADLLGKNGNVAQDTAMAKMLVGSAISIAFGSLAAEGLATGSGPVGKNDEDTRNLQAMWRLAGYQAHSIRIGDMWYDVHRLGPMGMLLGVAADMYDVSHAALQGDLVTAAGMMQHAFVQNILDESFMRGPADLIQAVEDPGRYGEAYIRNILASFLPYSVGMGQMARAADPYSRQARTIMDEIKLKVPGLSQTLFPRRNIWGDPMPSLDALGAKGVTAIYISQMSHDPVNQAMLDIGVHPGPPERKIRNVELTDQQYDDYARVAGRMTKMRLDKIVESQSFQRLPNGLKQTVISDTIRQCRETAANFIMARNPMIPVQAYQNKLAKLRGLPQ